MDGSRWTLLRHFKMPEFASPDAPGSGELMKTRLLLDLDALRSLIGRPMTINSGVRTPAHNARIGGAPASAHLTGEAVDVGTRGWGKPEREAFIGYALKLGFTGIGIGKTYIHLDIKERRASWRYNGVKIIAVPLGKELEYV